MTPILHLSWLIPPKELSRSMREAVADTLSGYAADILKGATIGEVSVTIGLPETDAVVKSLEMERG